MSNKDRIPVCMWCQWGYPIFMRPDFTKRIFKCPGCGHEISFEKWIIGDDYNE